MSTKKFIDDYIKLRNEMYYTTYGLDGYLGIKDTTEYSFTEVNKLEKVENSLSNFNVAIANFMTDWILGNNEVTANSEIFNYTTNTIKDIHEKYREFVGKMQDYNQPEVVEDVHKAYEYLLSELQNKEKGAIYTPEYIADYMNDESIEEYLRSNWKDLLFGDVDIKDLIHTNFNHIEDKTLAYEVLTLLSNVKVLEPSVGAGAFIINMLDKLTLWKINLYKILGIEKELRDIQEEIIHNNLYGVDIDSVALTFTECRLKIATENKVENLMKNFRQGNSIIDSIDGVKLTILRKEDVADNDTWMFYGDEISLAIKDRNIDDLLKISLEIQGYDLENEYGGDGPGKVILDRYSSLIGEDKPINYYIEFPEIMFNGGFDIVVGNPPYVRADRLTSYKDELKSLYSDVYNGNADLYVYFYKRGLDLLKTNGVLCYITSNKWIKAGYGKQLRTYLKEKKDMRLLLDFKENRVFDAGVDVNILVAKNCDCTDSLYYVDASKLDLEDISNSKISKTKMN